MKFDNSFYEDEVRDGFYVPAMIKRAWAAELEVLSEVDRICDKYNIRYFADWGTLLATVRHDGFIPWDDDLDIVMLRADYERFMAVCKDEFKEGYEAYNYKNNDDYWLYICRVVGKKRICFEEDHLDSFHQFPYIVGVDIFVLDYVSRDDETESARDSLARYTIVTADKIAEGQIARDEAIAALKVIDKAAGTDFVSRLSEIYSLDKELPEYKQKMDEFRRSAYSLSEELFAKFKEDEADFLTQLFPFGMQDKGFRFSKDLYKDSIRHRYENITMPVPLRYNQVLTKRYGDYMRLVKNAGAHGYPFFETQHQAFVKLLDFELPSYSYNRAEAVRDEQVAASRDLYFDKLLIIAKTIANGANMEMVDCQQLQEDAILLGNALETYEKNPLRIVAVLEQICEKAWGLSVAYQDNKECKGLENELRELAASLEGMLRGDCYGRRKVVFVCYKPEAFYRYQPYISQYDDDYTDVYVLPIPYSYKKYDGSVYASRYDIDSYPDGIKLEDYRSFDLDFLQPDIIYIQQPYDRWNPVTSVDPDFYSHRLKECCQQLVYIPWFVTEDFTALDHRQYHNAKDYVLMPGVVNADKVILQSEAIREVYLDRLVSWAGPESEDIWKEKLLVSDEEDIKKRLAKKQDKKTLVYHVEISSFAECDNIIDKIKTRLDIFATYKDRLDVIWYQSSDFDKALKEKFPDKYEDYACIRRDWMDIIGNGDFDKSSEGEAYRQLADNAHAYYGDGCSLAMLFNVRSKPVMLANYNI